MRKTRMAAISVLAAVCLACAVFALVACNSGGKAAAGKYGYGEEGVYYYTESSSEEYTLSMQSGTFMITMEGDVGSSGTYTVDEGAMEISFTGRESSFSAQLLDGMLSLSYDGGTYVFHRKVTYTVEFVGGGRTVRTYVLNGQPAEDPGGEADGYVFLGWYADEACTVPYAFTEGITQDTVIYGRYEERDLSVSEYAVTFRYKDGTEEKTETRNGRVYAYALPETDGGWWVSATNSFGELTYRYEEEVLREDTTLFEVAETQIGASVYADKVSWNGTLANVDVLIAFDGETVDSFSGAGVSEISYDFSSLPAGKYTVKITAGPESEERTYVSRALPRVSGLEVVYPGYLTYRPAEGAEKYVVRVEDADGTTYVDNGIFTALDISPYYMGEDGIRFTVYAVADGMYASRSEELAYSAVIEAPAVRMSGDTLEWDETKNVSYYEIYVNGAVAAVTTDTKYSFLYAGPGTYVLEVRPVLAGYYSEKSEALTYVKTTLAAPRIYSVEGGVIYWEKIDGATGYVIEIDGETYTVDTNSFATSEANFPSGSEEIAVRVKALGADSSPYCDAVFVTKSEMGSRLTYENGTVRWQYSLSADRYIVQVNGEDETEVTGADSAKITLTKYGDNTITVYFLDADGRKSSVAAITVTAYAVLFDARGGEITDGDEILYLAKGDEIHAPSARLDSYEFYAWYTLPDVTDFDDDSATEYSGRGTKLEDGTIFYGDTDAVYYAYYTPVSYTATLVAGNAYFTDDDGNPILDENGEYVRELEVKVYFRRSFTLPVAVSTDSTKIFRGWYTEKNTSGTQYADEYGNCTVVWNMAGDGYLYAGFYNLVNFSLTTYKRQTVAQVTKGSDIGRVSEVTVPSECEIDGVTYTVAFIGSSAFSSCGSLEVINIPDTILYISTVNNGYSSGTGAFSMCAKLKAVNVYATGDEADTTKEVIYYSDDGLLYEKCGDGVSLIFSPRAHAGSVVIPETVSNDYEYDLDSSMNAAKVERKVEKISSEVFSGNANLTSVTISSAVRLVDEQAFYKASSLKKVVFTDGGEGESLELARYAFRQCEALTDVTLPVHLSAMDAEAFYGCDSLAGFKMNADGAHYSVREGFLCDARGSEILYAPEGVTEFDISDRSVTAIGESAFYGCHKLRRVVIGETIREIGREAFSGDFALSSLTFSGTANSSALAIREGAFYGCTLLKEVTLPANLSVLEKNAFGGCTALASVTVESAGYLDFADGAFESYYGEYFVETLAFSSSAGYVNIGAVFGNKVTKITIPKDNPNFYVDDKYGVVYDAELTEIAYYPSGLAEYETPDSLTVIGANVFRGKTDLEKITIGAKVVTVGDAAFYGCTSLVTVIFDGAKSGEEEYEGEASSLDIEDYAFYGCTSLKDFELPQRLISIGDYAFCGCSSLTQITIPKNVERIGEYVGDTLVNAGHVFQDCSSLTSIKVEEGNTQFTSVSDGLLQSYDGSEIYFALTSFSGDGGTYAVSSAVTRIWDYTFYGNKGISTLIFEDRDPSAEFRIGEYTFAKCTSLTSVTLPEGLKELKEGLFSGCTKLTYVFIPETVEIMEVNVFKGDTRLSTIEFEERGADGSSPTPLELSDGNSDNSVFYGLSALTSISLPEGTTRVPEYAFSGCTLLKSVHIPSTVTELGMNAFRSHTITVTLTIAEGSGLTTIDDYCFYSCRLAETDFSVCENLKTVGEYAFGSCKSSKIVLPASVTTIDYNCFDSCTITEIIAYGSGYVGIEAFRNATCDLVVLCDATTFGLSAFTKCKIKEIYLCGTSDEGMAIGEGGSCFANSTSLTTLHLLGDIVSIGDSAFSGCTALTAVSFPASLKSIGASAFSGCTSLESAVFETDADGYCALAYIGDSAFSGCTALTAVSFPASLKSIGASAFSGCTSLESAVFETDADGYCALAYIGDRAFASTGLTRFEFPLTGSADDTGTITLGSQIFYGCTSIKYIYISDSVSDIKEVFDGNDSVIETIEVSPTSGNWCVVDSLGMVLSSDRTVLKLMYKDLPEELSGVLDLGSLTCTDASGAETKITLYEIGTYALAYTDGLVEVIIPDSLTVIGDYAFYNCSDLEKVTFGESPALTEIGAYAFYNCKLLETFDMPGGIAYIGDCAFRSCSALTEVSLGKSLTYLGSYAFASSGLQKVTIAEGLESLGSEGDGTGYQFSGCSKLTEVTIPSTLKYIGAGAFQSCSALTSIDLKNVESIAGGSSSSGAFYKAGLTELYIPATVTYVGSYAFSYCQSLLTVVFDADCADGAMGEYMFYYCNKMTSAILPTCADFTTVPAYAFQNCSKLTEINLGDNVTKLCDGAFYSSGLTSIDLNNVSSYGTEIFRSCTSLSEVTWPGFGLTDELAAATSMFDSCTSLTATELPSGLTVVPSSFLKGATRLESIVIPENVIEIGGNAFYGCTKLASVEFLGGVEVIGSYAFYNCAALTTIGKKTETEGGTVYEMPGLVSVGGYAFYQCSSMEQIDLGHVTEITGSRVFRNCTSLKEVDLSSLTSLDASQEYLFGYCSALEKVTLSDDLGTLGNYMFYSCTSLTDVNIPEHLTTFGTSVFRGCGLETAVIPSGVTEIPQYTFYSCQNLKEVVIEGAVTHITQYSFSTCPSLVSVTLPYTLTDIDTYAFYNDPALETIALPASLKTIGTYSFSSCTGLKSIVIPESVTSIGTYAFNGCTSLDEMWIGSSVASVGTSNTFANVTADMYIVNTRKFVEENWGSSWETSTKFAGTAYYYYDPDDVRYNEDGTAYEYSYWQLVRGEAVIVDFVPRA